MGVKSVPDGAGGDPGTVAYGDAESVIWLTRIRSGSAKYKESEMFSSGMNEKLRREPDGMPMSSHSLQVQTWLKPAEVERIYGLKKDTLRKWYYRGHIPGFCIIEGLKFRRADVERIINQRMPHLLERFKVTLEQAESVS